MRVSRASLFALLLATAAAACGQTGTTPPATTNNAQQAVIVERQLSNIAFQADGTSTEETTTRIKLQSDAGVQQFSVLRFPYAKATAEIQIDYVRVIKPDGTVIATPDQNVQDMPAAVTREAPFYSDQREKHVAVRGLATGDTLEFKVRTAVVHPEVAGQFWLEANFLRDVICKDEEFEVSVPKDKYIKLKSPDLQPTVREADGRRIYTWKTSNLQLKPPAKSMQAPAAAKPPSIELTTFHSWDELGQWYASLQRDRTVVTPDIRAKALELTKGLSTDTEKLDAIYHYVSTQVRYVGLAFGIGRMQPHAASDVLANAYGDCKDKHTLLAALLKAVGIEAWPALIPSSRDIDPDIPSPRQFDHMITVVSLDHKLLWMDTTAEVAPRGFLMANLRDKDALVIYDGQPPALVKTPADPPFTADTTFTLTGKLASDGTLTAHVERSIRDDAEIPLRLAFRRTPQAQWPQLVQQISYLSNFAGTVSNSVVSTPEDTKAPFRMSYDYKRTDYPDWTNHRINPPMPPLLPPPPADDEKWSEPMLLGARGEFVYSAKMELPPGYTPVALPPVDIKSDFAEYRATYTVQNDTLSVERRLLIKKGRLATDELAEYRKFCKAVADDRDQYVETRGPGSSAPVVANGENTGNAQTDQWYKQAREAISRQDVLGAQEYVDRILAVDPTHRDAWALKGFVLTLQNRPDEAIDAFKKEIANHPDSIRTYRALAQLQARLHREDDAIETLRGLLKAAPEDLQARVAVGQTLIIKKRYDQAIEAMQAGAPAGNPSPTIEMLLGTAYAHTGRKDQALQAFQKAAAADTSANMANSVGYELADAGLELDKAKEYAVRAVNSVEAETQTITLPQLNPQDLGRMNILAAYWDTLGWVYFKSGDLDQAERYLRAAWILSQNATEGDHLGQVFEKQNKWKAAAHQYELALSASGLSDRSETEERLRQLTTKHPGAAEPRTTHKAGPRRGMVIMSPAEELSRMRSVKVGHVAGVKNGSAEFFVLLSNTSKTAEVKFISGDEALRSAASALAIAPFDQVFPDDNPTKIVRRGILTCSQYTPSRCDFVLLTPGMVRSLE